MARHPARRLFRSTPVRQALGLVAVVAVVNLLTLGLAWLKLRADAEAGIRATLAQAVAGLDG